MSKECLNCGSKIESEKKGVCANCGLKPDYLKEDGYKPYNNWMRAFSILYGGIGLAAAPAGFMWYLESGLISVLIGYSISLLIAVILVLLGLLPNKTINLLNINDKSRLLIFIIILIIIDLIAIGFVPEPPGGWWNYNPWQNN
ncbi:hypothetical protein [Methanosalsum natronophilum]|uniref:Uncharacterized protein n=1 Tax=Methanosalsum natronophilum TaxID=768733 RepID=A0A424YNX5_9EURY|nr:hypothetical protein [Methanosalsum natronophilum]MCS3924135.1 hypothetical protein [Methanosalsum natronophilum]RQD80588.1 MAG: hypothetical protein D5R95_08645 [Methanosalsum natronophilum]